MRLPTLVVSILVVLGLGAALGGCKQTRADYRNDIADAVCSEMKQCGALDGEDAEFADYDDCVTELRETYNDLWPADQCGGGRIDAQKYDQCKKRAVSSACDDNILDMLSFRMECAADDVCVAEGAPDE